MKFIPFLFMLLVVLLPDVASAATPSTPGGLISCQGAGCSACDVVDLVNNLVQWLIGILMIVFAIIVTVAGFGLVTSGGNPAAKTEAKQKLINAFIGLIIVLSAWLLVDTLMRMVLSGGAGEINGRLWTEISCGAQAAPSAASGGAAPPPTAGIETSAEGQVALDNALARCVSPTIESLTAPTTNLCSPDTAASIVPSVTGDGPWYWNCGAASCYALVDGGAETDPGGNGCGTAVDSSVVDSRPADAALCVIPGTAQWEIDNPREGRPFLWNCGLVSCNVEYDPTMNAELRCGTAAGVATAGFPARNLCEGPSGVYSDPTDVTGTEGTDGFNWTCQAYVSIDSVPCSAPKSQVNSCDAEYAESAGGTSTGLPPFSSRCEIGSPTTLVSDPAVEIGEMYRWSCNGGGGDRSFCESRRTYDPEEDEFCGEPGNPSCG